MTEQTFRADTLVQDVRHGTTTLFAALNVASGDVVTSCKKRHRHQEYLQFLKQVDESVPKRLDIHLVVDNYATQKHEKVKRWLSARPRYHVHFTPTYASWLNQVEIWFNLITQRAIRRGTFRSFRDLVRKIDGFVRQYKKHPSPFQWTATADSILGKMEDFLNLFLGQHTSMSHPILVTGATGYVGGRLRRLLEADGRRVRCLARRPMELASRGGELTEVVKGDVLDAESLGPALAGVESAYYLIHSMGSSRDFEEEDRTAARNFGSAARRAGVQRIIYLGGIGHGRDLSPHLRSRHEVGGILRESGVPVVELRASIVIGSGSLSFELIRALVERLPVMITPRWVEVEAQPIAVDDLLAYLAAALDVPLTQSRVFEIGGADRVNYGELMREYARQRGLRRTMIRVPILTPQLSSLWLGLVTPLYARVGRKLIESIKHPTVVRDESALGVFAVRPRGIREAIAAAIRNEEREIAASRWSDAFSSGGESRNWAGVSFGNRFVDSRERKVDVGPDEAFTPIRRIGGATGWYAYNWLWRLRGFLDLLIGGVGVRRGRPEPDELHVGDALDFWRVEAYEPGRLLRLAAEMRLPGRAWLEFEVVPREGGATIRQTALFDPVGLGGLAYWYALYPLHRHVFSGMVDGIARAASDQAEPVRSMNEV